MSKRPLGPRTHPIPPCEGGGRPPGPPKGGRVGLNAFFAYTVGMYILAAFFLLKFLL